MNLTIEGCGVTMRLYSNLLDSMFLHPLWLISLQGYHSTSDSFSCLDMDYHLKYFNILALSFILADVNFSIKTNFRGMPCLSHPDFDCYLEPPLVSGVSNMTKNSSTSNCRNFD